MNNLIINNSNDIIIAARPIPYRKEGHKRDFMYVHNVITIFTKILYFMYLTWENLYNYSELSFNNK